MADRLTPAKRSWNMSRIGQKNTLPEMATRSLLHQTGIRFRLHHKNLPGKPDIVLAKHKTAIFVHGCFWHHHKGCKDIKVPKTNTLFWIKKFQTNSERDRRNRGELKKMGWKTIVIWECELKNPRKVIASLRRELERKSGIKSAAKKN